MSPVPSRDTPDINYVSLTFFRSKRSATLWVDWFTSHLFFTVRHPPSKITPNILLNTPQHSFHPSTTYIYNLTSKWKVYRVRKSAYMISLKNKVIFSFILSGLLFSQRIFRFYEKAEVTLLSNYLGIGFWADAFLCPSWSYSWSLSKLCYS